MCCQVTRYVRSLCPCFCYVGAKDLKAIVTEGRKYVRLFNDKVRTQGAGRYDRFNQGLVQGAEVVELAKDEAGLGSVLACCYEVNLILSVNHDFVEVAYLNERCTTSHLFGAAGEAK